MNAEAVWSGVKGLQMSRKVPIEGRLILAGEITLQSVESIHARLLEMAGEPIVEIDCDGVTEADVSLVQLILAARSSAQRSARSVTLARPAAGALLETLQRGGFLNADADQPSADRAFWAQAVGM
jgi:ABC-type transporter Mla MlaB component